MMLLLLLLLTLMLLNANIELWTVAWARELLLTSVDADNDIDL
jgi:hypothetical protein